MGDIKALRLLESTPKPVVEDFLTTWFEWRTTGLVIRSFHSDIDVDYGDWIILCPDGTFAAFPDKEWDSYMMTLGKAKCIRPLTNETTSTKTR